MAVRGTLWDHGLKRGRFLYARMITDYWGMAWQPPAGAIAVILALPVLLSLAAPFAPARRLCALPVSQSINGL